MVSQMWTSAWKKNYSYHICEIYSDNLAVCLYIKFSLCLYSVENVWNAMYGTRSFGMLLSKFSSRNTHVCTSSIRMISFLPFSVNCSQVAMFQIMLALSPHGQGEGG